MTRGVLSDTDRLYFMHIPKTAGSALTKLLRSYFAEGEFCMAVLYSQLVDIPLERLRQYRGFAGHFHYGFHWLFDEPLRMITFLRDPVKHVVSHAAYMHFFKKHAYYPRAKSMSLAQILRDEELRRGLDNHQARLLALDVDPAPLLEQARIQRGKGYLVERAIWWQTPPMSDDETVARAKAHLDRFDFVGLTGRFAESMYVLCTMLGWKLPTEFPVANVGDGKFSEDEHTEETRSLIQELVGLDTLIYEYAQEIFGRQLQKHPVDVQAMNENLIKELVSVKHDRDLLYRQSPRRVWNGIRRRWNALRGVRETSGRQRP